MLAAPSEKAPIKMYSAEFYQACTIGGILSCALVARSLCKLPTSCSVAVQTWHRGLQLRTKLC